MEPKEEIKVAVLEEKMITLTKSVEILSGKIDNLTDKIDDKYLKKEDFARFKVDEFIPIQNNYDKLIWWIIGTLLAALGGLLLAVINYFQSRH